MKSLLFSLSIGSRFDFFSLGLTNFIFIVPGMHSFWQKKSKAWFSWALYPVFHILSSLFPLVRKKTISSLCEHWELFCLLHCYHLCFCEFCRIIFYSNYTNTWHLIPSFLWNIFWFLFVFLFIFTCLCVFLTPLLPSSWSSVPLTSSLSLLHM